MRGLVLVMCALGCSANAKVSASAKANADNPYESTYGDGKSEGGWDEPPPPGASAAPKSLAGGAPTPGALATLPGFRMARDGSSHVYVEVIGRVPVSQSKTNGRVVIHMPGVRVPDKVNKMALPTTHFNSTPVGRVALVQVNEDADLVIELRAPSPSRTRVEQSDSATLVRVDFPRFGSGPPASQESAPEQRHGQPSSRTESQY